MKKLAILALTSLTILFTDCKSKSSARTSSPSTTKTDNPVMDKQTIVKYRLGISFTSHASGIDAAKYDLIESYVKNHAKKPAFDILPMGREGERDICMHLKEMNSSEQKAFIEEIKKLAQGSDRVVITENTERTILPK